MHQAITIFSESYCQTNNTTHFSRAYIKQYWHFQSWRLTILHTFPELPSNDTDIFRELLANSTTHFSRVYTKQYWHFQRVSFKLNYSKKFFQSSYHTILTLSESYYQTILTYLELISNSIHTFTELIPNSSKHFFWSFNGHLNRENSPRENSKVKVWKVSMHTWSR